MSKPRKAILIFDIICAIIAAVLVIVNVCKGRFGAAILWNMNFSLWLYNTAESLRFGEMEKIIMKSEEGDNEKKNENRKRQNKSHNKRSKMDFMGRA